MFYLRLNSKKNKILITFLCFFVVLIWRTWQLGIPLHVKKINLKSRCHFGSLSTGLSSVFSQFSQFCVWIFGWVLSVFSYVHLLKMDEVADLLKTWELPDLIPKFEEQAITIQALSALTLDDIKDIIPQTGPRVLFMRCWRAWQAEFSSISLSNLDLCPFEFSQESLSDSSPKGLIIVPAVDKENVPINDQITYAEQEQVLKSHHQRPESGLLESILLKSLEASSLLIYKGGTLDGDATRNLLASIIAREILNEHTSSPIVGPIYFKWANLIKELFPGERTTTYYIPACTTASGSILQARGKLVHQVLNKRRRLQQLGALTINRKRSREDSPSAIPSSSRLMPISLSENNSLDENVEDDLQWLRNSSEPWSLVEVKWNATHKYRMAHLYNKNNNHTLESYINEYPALKKPHGYNLLNIDFEAAYGEKKDNLFVHFPVAKNRILELLNKRKTKDNFSKDLTHLADSSKEEDKNLAAFLSIPYLLNTTTIKQKNNKKNNSTCSWKPSKAETRDAFIKHLKSDVEIGQYIELRLKTLQNKGATSQPYMIIVGESLKDIKTCLVLVNKSVLYQRNNIMQAVDTCYKAIWALNLEYGVDSSAVWYFIQKGLYKMTSKFDRGSTSAESLLTDCNI